MSHSVPYFHHITIFQVLNPGNTETNLTKQRLTIKMGQTSYI